MSFYLEQMESSNKGQASTPSTLGAQQLSLTSMQSAQVDLLPRFHPPVPVNIRSQVPTYINHGSYQLAFTNEQQAQMGASTKGQAQMLISMDSQEISSTNKFMPEKKSSFSAQNPMFLTAETQLSPSNKRPAQKEALLKFHAPTPQTSTNKRPPQTEPPLKVQTESFESVRSKLRESLTSSLSTSSPQQSKPEVREKNFSKEVATTASQAEVRTEPVEGSSSVTPNTSLLGSSLETLTTTVKYDDECQNIPSNAGSNENMSDHKNESECYVSNNQAQHATVENEAPLDDNSTTKDQLLQVHGLCWASDSGAENSEEVMVHGVKRAKLVHEEVTEDANVASLPKPESLAIKIEEELFRLFGGVNKKYKEKGRSLLFNLKDPNNPELKERVLSGDIAPERLCSMTAEELASKKLSEWRIAKAEEYAQMVVLPDSDVDIRRLVKKTHKGEFQVVEVEQDDSVSVEVEVGASVLSQIPAKANEPRTQSKSNEAQALSKPRESKASKDLMLSVKTDSSDQNTSSNLDNLLNDKADFMQEFMVDELKDTELLPPIVSLDEFMEALDTEPPFENLSMDAVQDTPDSAETNSDNLENQMNPASDSLEPKSIPASSDFVTKLDSTQESLGSKLHAAITGSEISKEIAIDNTGKGDLKHTRPECDSKSGSVHVKLDVCLPDITSRSENIWEGLLQLNISSSAMVIGFFRSGEKTSTQEWPSFLEIKGRVRLDAFEKFLQELPLSRSRAIMIAQFCWKEGSVENGRLNLLETVDSYVTDERVGFAEPIPGVELYFCPPHLKTTEMLVRHLPKDHTETLNSTINGLIGVVVWRRPHVTTMSPRLPSHHKHGGSSKKQSSSRKQQSQNVINSNSIASRSSLPPSGPPPTNLLTTLDEPIDDVPPGFGPGNARVEDDLPEFNFVPSNSHPSGSASKAQINAPQLPPPPARPAEQMRELIHRYGQGETTKKPGIEIKPWNDEDDDIPEWQPQRDNQPPPQQLPPPPPLQLQHHGYQQQTVQQQQPPPPFLVNQHLILTQPQQPMPQTHIQLQQPMSFTAPMPMLQQLPFQPQMGLMPGWQQAQWWPQAQVAPDMNVGLQINGVMQPCHFGSQLSNGQFYAMPGIGSVPNGMGWRPDVARR